MSCIKKIPYGITIWELEGLDEIKKRNPKVNILYYITFKNRGRFTFVLDGVFKENRSLYNIDYYCIIERKNEKEFIKDKKIKSNYNDRKNYVGFKNFVNGKDIIDFCKEFVNPIK